ncbi:MAG: FkbM family methyltransferase [Clostridia bacterium]|nr:FkbM family methyltransferase [Clostridia bacterium]
MKDIWNYLKETDKPIVLYGMGNGADKIVSVCENNRIKISGVFSSDSFVRPKTFHGMPVTSYKTAKEIFGDMIVLLSFGTHLPDVIENIKKIAADSRLYAPDVPVYGDTLFDFRYYQSRKNEFNGIYNILSDEQSRKVFENTVKYKLTGDISYLLDCETDEDEAYSTFFRLTENETFLDLGAYRGDTVLAFANRAKVWNGIIAVEPDVKTYKKLLTATENICNIRCINAAAADICGEKTISVNGSRGKGACGKAVQIKTLSVDSLGVSPTYIKMDIEGDEAKAISGAEDTIIKCKPKMKIAAYHRSGDLIDIPKQVLNLRRDYRIYLRHNPCLPAWDTDYFFI